MKNINVMNYTKVYRRMSDPILTTQKIYLPSPLFNKDNIFIIPIDLYDSLIIICYDLLECLINLPYVYDLELSYKLGNVLKYGQINRDIQHTLIKIINKKGKSFTNISVYTDQLKFHQDMRVDPKIKPESFNSKYICELGLGLGDHYPNINPSTLRDFYILNDVNYLNSSPYVLQNIKLNIIISLIEANIELNSFNQYLMASPYKILSKNTAYDFKIYKKEYNIFIKHYKAFFNKFDVSTLKLFNDRLRKKSKFITSNNVKETRILKYFYYLL